MSSRKARTPAAKATKDAPAKAAGNAPGKGQSLKVADDGRSRDRLLAELAGAGVAGNAFVLTSFSKGTFGELSLTDAIAVVNERAKAIHAGDLHGAETLLAAQALALNAIFGELARRSAINMGEYLDASERYMRLALKAQGQCRATLETLAAIKNPPVVFARQANINNGGQQQVNNGAAPNAGPEAVRAPVPAQRNESPRSELLEAGHGQGLDTGTAGKAGGADPHLATVGAFDGAAQR